MYISGCKSNMYINVYNECKITIKLRGQFTYKPSSARYAPVPRKALLNDYDGE